MLRRMPSLTDNQRNARVMWSQNDTRRFVKDHFTESDHAFVRSEARRVDRSGAAKKTRSDLNRAFIERVKTNEARQAKASEKRAANKRRLDQIKILEGATRERLSQLTVQALNEQLEKLRETDQETPTKSTIRTKESKVSEVLKALERRKNLLNSGELCSKARESNSEASSMIGGEGEGGLRMKGIKCDDELELGDE